MTQTDKGVRRRRSGAHILLRKIEKSHIAGSCAVKSTFFLLKIIYSIEAQARSAFRARVVKPAILRYLIASR
jgi:hypothetical protein